MVARADPQLHLPTSIPTGGGSGSFQRIQDRGRSLAAKSSRGSQVSPASWPLIPTASNGTRRDTGARRLGHGFRRCQGRVSASFRRAGPQLPERSPRIGKPFIREFGALGLGSNEAHPSWVNAGCRDGDLRFGMRVRGLSCLVMFLSCCQTNGSAFWGRAASRVPNKSGQEAFRAALGSWNLFLRA